MDMRPHTVAENRVVNFGIRFYGHIGPQMRLVDGAFISEHTIGANGRPTHHAGFAQLHMMEVG